MARHEHQRVVDLVGDPVGEIDEHLGPRPIAALQRLFDHGGELPRTMRIEQQPRADAGRMRGLMQFARGAGDEHDRQRGPELPQQAQRADLLGGFGTQLHEQQLGVVPREVVAVVADVGEAAHLGGQRQLPQRADEVVGDAPDDGDAHAAFHGCEVPVAPISVRHAGMEVPQASRMLVRCHHTCGKVIPGGYSRGPSASDTNAVTGDREQPGGEAGSGGSDGPQGPRPGLRRVDGPVAGAEPVPEVRLHREFKGLTVADLMRAEIAERLPGQVRQALRQIQNGEFAAADDALPGAFPPIYAGPGSDRGRRRGFLVLWLSVAVLAAAGALAWWWT